MSDLIFGGTPLLKAHFESEVARAVFNDKQSILQKISSDEILKSIESRLFILINRASPKLLMSLAPKIDFLIVPILSASGFRQFCCFFCENLPQAIQHMPNTRESVTSLARAVHLSKFINPAALARIRESLNKEGF